MVKAPPLQYHGIFCWFIYLFLPATLTLSGAFCLETIRWGPVARGAEMAGEECSTGGWTGLQGGEAAAAYPGTGV